MGRPAARGRHARGALLVLAAGLLGFGAIAARNVVAAGSDAGLEITATASGFQPKVVRLRKGESVRLVLRTTEREQCFAVDELRVEKRILPGRDTLVDLTPDKVGSFAFYSCLEPDNPALRGRLIVSE